MRCSSTPETPPLIQADHCRGAQWAGLVIFTAKRTVQPEQDIKAVPAKMFFGISTATVSAILG